MKNKSLTLLACCGAYAFGALARPANTDEAKVAPYTLPDPLTFRDGTKLTSAGQWPKRREEILALFEDQMYGTVPPAPATVRIAVLESGDAFGGRATRKQLRMWFSDSDAGPRIDWLLYVPKQAAPAPVFVGLNFHGNHAVSANPAVPVATCWLRNNDKHGVANNRPSEKGRATDSGNWPVETLLARGYALATACYGDIDPDYDDGYTNGVHALFPPPRPVPGNYTTSLAAWAWGLMRGMDLIEREPALDAKQVAVIGLSRLAKAALLAGAKDERFAVVIPVQTGGGGTPLAKRDFGENVALQNQNFPHWFCGNFRKYSDNEAALPFDQHMLLACVAPRRLYVSSFPGAWFDPYGEFLSMKAAEPAWQFLGLPGLPATAWPAEMAPSSSTHLAYHRRPGEHSVSRYDWDCYLAFTDRAFGRAIDWQPTKTDTWKTFTRHTFTVDGCPCWVAVPPNPRPGNPWVWCLEFPTAFDSRTGVMKLVEDGFYYVHMSVGNTFGAPSAQAHLDAFYSHIVAKGLSPQGTLIGVSRGGLYAYRFAARNPSRVVCVYGDAPVCDFKSWPGGKGKGKGSKGDWASLMKLYDFKDEAEALAFKGNPVDILEPLAKVGVPLIHVVGDADDVVPVEENTAIIEARYKALGGTINVFHKPGVGHHPHGLDDPTPVADLIKTYTTRGDIERCK